MIHLVLMRKKYICRMAGILAGVTIFTMISHGLNEMSGNVSQAAWCRILWHYFYEDKGKIDNLYLGSSHVYSGMDPSVLDRLSGQYHFNLASPNQQINSSYYLLREAERLNELKHVYLELYYECNDSDNKLDAYGFNWGLADYMEPSLNKAAFMFAIGDEDQYVNTLLPFTRYQARRGDWEFVKKQWKEKETEAYRNYRYEIYDETGNVKLSYKRQGYQWARRIYEDSEKLYRQDCILSEYSMGERVETYYRKIIMYCQEREIPITLYIAPIYHLQLISTLDYDNYIGKMKALAAEYEIPFYDFNLVKEEYLAIQDGKYFRNPGHLNEEGAKLFSSFFYQVVSGEETESKNYFYDSYQEKLKNLPPTLYGVYYAYPTEEEDMKTMWIASNRDAGMEYRIIMMPEEGEQYMLQDFNENKEFQVPLTETGICTIEARTGDAPKEVQTMEIQY